MGHDNELHICKAVIDESSNSLKFNQTIDSKIKEWPYSLPHGEVSYRLNSYSNDMKKSLQRKSVTAALNAWQSKIWCCLIDGT